MRLTICAFFLSFLCLNLTAQEWEWWNELHDWNGVTPWRRYLQLSSSGLGPNALPVPTFNSRGVKEGFRLDNELRYHHFKEDPTFDHQFRLDYGFQDRIGVAIWMVTVEHYNTSIKLRNQRKLREFEPKGFTSGDVYLSTYLHLLKENARQPDLLVSANLKTASGNNYGGGRHTDTPGYYFDLLLAKTFSKWRPYIASGLYVYQTFSTRNYQNDAYLYGLGFHYLEDQYQVNIEWAGYNGYFDIGDKPSVLRANINVNLMDQHAIIFRTQFALNDLDYHTFSLGYTYIYSK